MKHLLHKLTAALAGVKSYLIAFGAFGLFAIALLDSSFVPLPSGVDAAVLLLSAATPAMMPVYVFTATAGSVLGTLILYFVARRAGRRVLARFSPAKQARVQELIDRYDMLSVLVASLLPPPAPFKLFVITSGVLRMSVVRFTIAVTAGRVFRFLLEGYLAARYGDSAKEVLARYYPTIGLGLAALVIVAFVARALLRKRSAEGVGEVEVSGE